MLQIYKSVLSRLDQRGQGMSQQGDVSGGIYRYSGIVKVDGPGETVINLPFPILFVEKPIFYHGAEVDPSTPVGDGGYPLVIPVIRNWLYRINEERGTRWYVGASVLLVSSGHDLQSLIVGCHFEGKGLRDPIS